MKTYEVKKEELKGVEPICYGYKAIKWDSSTLQGDFNYGKNPVGKVFKVDGDISECSWGLHFSKDPAHVFNFYEPLGYNRYFKVAAGEKKMNDNDVVKALEYCADGGYCGDCGYDIKSAKCIAKIMKNSIDLIIRQGGYHLEFVDTLVKEMVGDLE